MKWIGQNIWSFISRFRSDVYLEDISTGTIASGSHLGLDSNNKIVKAADGGGDLTSIVAGTGLSGTSLTGPIPTLSVDAAQIHVTSVGTIGTGTWQGTGVASAYLDTDTAHLTTDQTFTGSKTFSNDTTTLTSGNANDPLLLVQNTANDATSGRIRFLNNRGADGQDGDSAGMIQFYSYDDGTPSAQQYGRIQTKIDVAASGEESGDMILSVANHDGGLETGLTLTGGSVNAEVDVTIGTGAASVTTVAGNLIITGSTVIKVLPKDFMSNDQGGSNKSILFDDSGTLGVRASANDSELYAFVEIPFGKTATAVRVYGNDSGNVVQVYNLNIDASAALGTTDGSGNNITHASGCVVGTACDIVNTDATTTNYLAIKVTTTNATNDIIYGASVAISNT